MTVRHINQSTECIHVRCITIRLGLIALGMLLLLFASSGHGMTRDEVLDELFDELYSISALINEQEFDEGKYIDYRRNLIVLRERYLRKGGKNYKAILPAVLKGGVQTVTSLER